MSSITHDPANPDHEEHSRDDYLAIEKQFADKQLGTYRGTLLQALADYDIAAHEEEKTPSLRRQGSWACTRARGEAHSPGHQAKLEAAIEQVAFDAAQENRLANQALRQAEAGVVDAAQRLRILGVPEDIRNLLEHAEQGNTPGRGRRRDLLPDRRSIRRHDHEEVGRAQPEGGHERRPVHPGRPQHGLGHGQCARVGPGQAAQDPDGTFRFTATAYPGREFRARLLSFGSVVDPQTRTVPIRAEADNREGCSSWACSCESSWIVPPARRP